MAEPKKTSKKTKPRPPARTQDGRENQLIALAVDLAEKQLADGTATSQVITHYLKLGSTKDKIEKEILKEQRDHLRAKTEAIKKAANVEKLYKEALEAMRIYSGNKGEKEDG